jgi:hypothetical protein
MNIKLKKAAAKGQPSLLTEVCKIIKKVKITETTANKI